MSTQTTAPAAIREAWQILASAAYILDTERPTMRDLLAMTVLGDAMDALTVGRQPGEHIDIGDHAPHPPYQAARCALTVLDTYRTDQPADRLRVTRARRHLRRLIDGPSTAGQGRGAS
ncbi:hypothetical protein CLV30_101140 [Haloactinopolyspora alba]|uniref:Uncharacterized protein n=1 Tax=Haloactinopolyspora alba TaxID=648780 RepID=A0A2P8EFD7_9ACTN|nr:hypothetical protein [Haloactinopolyspora alba]PSL08173.1 hypothetical protein CLV30_101140 [Haloactinopolyspora alba]